MGSSDSSPPELDHAFEKCTVTDSGYVQENALNRRPIDWFTLGWYAGRIQAQRDMFHDLSQYIEDRKGHDNGKEE